MADQRRDVIEVLEHDHREVEQMFAELESLRGAASEEDRARAEVFILDGPPVFHAPDRDFPG
jgi:hypothetical protein